LTGFVGFALYAKQERSSLPEESPTVPAAAADNKQPPLNLLAVLPHLEYADTPALRAQGLSGRESLPESVGLFFVFEESGLHGFWMKDMRFAIDMIWLDEAGVVVGLKEGATPASYPEVFYPEHPAHFVLEANVGFIARHDLKLDSFIEIPSR
jgi:uncharacterized membrane protein (UPF0127 family)